MVREASFFLGAGGTTCGLGGDNKKTNIIIFF